MFGGWPPRRGEASLSQRAAWVGILVRVGPERSDRLAKATKASVAVMQGRPMPGWLRVGAEDVRTKRQPGGSTSGSTSPDRCRQRDSPPSKMTSPARD